jgi:hypothetical protein
MGYEDNGFQGTIFVETTSFSLEPICVPEVTF